jgi:hypothetical protein
MTTLAISEDTTIPTPMDSNRRGTSWGGRIRTYE